MKQLRSTLEMSQKETRDALVKYQRARIEKELYEQRCREYCELLNMPFKDDVIKQMFNEREIDGLSKSSTPN